MTQMSRLLKAPPVRGHILPDTVIQEVADIVGAKFGGVCFVIPIQPVGQFGTGGIAQNPDYVRPELPNILASAGTAEPRGKPANQIVIGALLSASIRANAPPVLGGVQGLPTSFALRDVLGSLAVWELIAMVMALTDNAAIAFAIMLMA
jgi:hypothetical protein